jgi:hypothetical protein
MVTKIYLQINVDRSKSFSNPTGTCIAIFLDLHSVVLEKDLDLSTFICK